MSYSRRLSRRQAREKEELEELNAAKLSSQASQPTEDAEVSEQETEEQLAEEVTTRGAPVSIFAAFGDKDEVEDDPNNAGYGEDHSDQDKAPKTKSNNRKKNKKKNKKGKTQTAAIGQADEMSINESFQANPAGMKSKQKSSSELRAPVQSLADMSLDDFDSLLASQPYLSKNDGSSKPLASTVARGTLLPTSPISALRASLSLSPNHLDPNVELKRQFGSVAIRAYEASNGGTFGGARGAARARILARNSNLKMRSVLLQPREDWPPISRTFTGFNGEVIDTDAADKTGDKVATWEHTKAYRTVQYEFQQAVATHSPEAIYALLPSSPWHVHLLSSMSDIAKHQGDLGQASDWNARILFAYERTASPVFVSSLTSPSGPMSVDFSKVENRGLFLAVHRMITFLSRRGTWRTALEWCKLLLALDPADPHGSLLWLDFLVIKSRQHKWLIEDFLPKLRASRNVDWLGGLAFAEALAVRALEREEGTDKMAVRSTCLLKGAISQHPYFVPPLASKVSLTLPNGFADHGAASTRSKTSFSASRDQQHDSLREVLAELYAVRSDSLWKDIDLKHWLKQCIFEAWDVSQRGSKWDNLTPAPSLAAREGVWRHLIVADIPDALRQQLSSRLPRSITSDSNNLNAYDPLPPSLPHTTRINDEYFSSLFLRGGGVGGAACIRSTVPGEVEEEGGGEGMMGRIAAFANQLGRFLTQQQQEPMADGAEGGIQNISGGLTAVNEAGMGQGQHEMMRVWMNTLDGMSTEQREEMQRLFAAGAMAPPIIRSVSGDEDDDTSDEFDDAEGGSIDGQD